MSDARNAWLLARFQEMVSDGEVTVLFVGAAATHYPKDLVPLNDNGFGALKFSHNYHTELRVFEGGVAQRLSFKGEHHNCVIPWGAVVSLRDSWRVVAANPGQSAEAPKPEPPKKKTNPFRVLQGGKTDA